MTTEIAVEETRSAELRRLQQDDEGTVGILVSEGFGCVTLELPWRENRRGRSCIPCGAYRCEYLFSRKFQRKLYFVLDVPQRAGITFHIGNWAGDRECGFHSDVDGCIVVGEHIGALAPRPGLARQTAVLDSAEALERLHTHFGGEPFSLTIYPVEAT